MSFIYQFFEFVLQLLPNDPFLVFLQEFKGQAWLGYLNFFIPISFMVNVTAVWVGVVMSYRIIKIIIDFLQKVMK